MFTISIGSLIRAGVVVAATLGLSAYSQTFPYKPIKIIVPFPPGGVLDSLARGLGQRMQAAMGQPVFVENQAGASGNIGLSSCARAPADGYTICITTNDTISFNPFLFKKMPLDPATELTPVQRLVWVNGVLFTSVGSGYKTLNEAIAAERQKAGSVNWGSFGIGSTSHLYLSWLNDNNKVAITHVPYKGSAPLVQGALTNEIQLGFLASGILMPHIISGKIVPLAVVGDKRIATLPNVPTLPETGFDFYIRTWFGAFAPKGTPSEIVERLNTEMAKVLNEPTFQQGTLEVQGFRSAATTTSDFSNFLREDRRSAAMLVKTANVSMD
jgi:tripartite-type tricarboxylate transporter receptor subunit TctC